MLDQNVGNNLLTTLPLNQYTEMSHTVKVIFFYYFLFLSYDVASGSEITPCNKIDKPLVVYRFTGNVTWRL